MCCLKSIFICAIQENIHFMNVPVLMKGEDRTVFVLYFLVTSLQNTVKYILDDFIMIPPQSPIQFNHQHM